MTHQPDPVIDAVQDRHVESIILSGSPFVSAILGPGAYRITDPFAPLWYTAPVITGSLFPPSVLSCGEGSFNSSPRATITYQWKKDTVNITDETNNTYTTVLGDVGSTITCQVTITNPSGSDIAVSNGLLMAAMMNLETFEMDVMPIQGFSQPDRIDSNTVNLTIISGMSHYDKIDENELDVYALIGMLNNEKIDVEEADIYGMSGMANSDSIAIDESDIYALTGHASDQAIASGDHDVYAMFHPVSLDDLVVVNGDAENSVMTDWTMDTGEVFSVTTAPDVDTAHIEGSRFFKPDNLGLGVDSQMSQSIEIPTGDLTDIDTGRCYCVAYVQHDSEEGRDHIEITLEALNAALGVIGTANHVFLSNPSGHAWAHDNTLDNALSIPTLTRHVKITVLFKAHDTLGGPDNNGYLDDIRLKLMKTA